MTNTPIRKTHLLFEKHFGTNMREWPESAVDLKGEINKHLSESLQLAHKRGTNDGREEMLTVWKKCIKDYTNG